MISGPLVTNGTNTIASDCPKKANQDRRQPYRHSSDTSFPEISLKGNDLTKRSKILLKENDGVLTKRNLREIPLTRKTPHPWDWNRIESSWLDSTTHNRSVWHRQKIWKESLLWTLGNLSTKYDRPQSTPTVGNSTSNLGLLPHFLDIQINFQDFSIILYNSKLSQIEIII